MEKDHYKTSDRENRIAKRRQRVTAALSSQSEAAIQSSGDGTEGKEHTLGQTLLAESANSMLSLSNSIWADHAVLQHQCRDREHSRSMEDQALREDLKMMSVGTSEAVAPLSASIASSWEALAGISVAQDLHSAVKQQQEACSRALASKDSLLAAMKEALTAKEAHYVQTLGEHARELDTFLLMMGSQSQALSQQQCEQTKHLSSAMSADRSEILRNCRAQLEAQLEECSAAEQAYLDKYLAATVQHQQDLNVAHDEAAAEHERLRQRLDDELQQQELLLASLRRANQQREDQLAYARRTLHEQTEERSAILEQQKRQLAALRDSLHTLKRDYVQAEKEHAAMDEDLTRSYTHNIEVQTSQQDRAQRYRRSESAKQAKVLELKSHEIQEMLIKLVQLQSVLESATSPACVELTA